MKGYAGVLPWVKDPKGKLWILLGREADGPAKGKWSDFGGGVEAKDSSILKAAFREMGEETMGLLGKSEDEVDKICPSLTFDYGSFHGTLILGMVGTTTSTRLTKAEWKSLQGLPEALASHHEGTCKASKSPTCEKDRAEWIRVDKIRAIESSLLISGERKSPLILPLRKSYGHLLSRALAMLLALTK